MARPSNLDALSVEQLEQLLEKRRTQEHESKRKELIEARAKVKELEAYFAGKKTRKGKSSFFPKVKKTRGKRGELKTLILTLLKHAPHSIKDLVKATKGNYGSVSQLLMKLKKDKIIIKESKRGGAYSLAK